MPKMVQVLWLNEKKHITILKSYDYYSFRTEFELGYENSYGHYIIEIFAYEKGKKKNFENMRSLYDYYTNEEIVSRISKKDKLIDKVISKLETLKTSRKV